MVAELELAVFLMVLLDGVVGEMHEFVLERAAAQLKLLGG